jgi:DnaA family protein
MLSLKQAASLDNYIPGDNIQALSEIRESSKIKSGKYLYLWGSSATGKTHLATAAAKMANDNGLAAAFIPLSRAMELSPEMLDDIEQMKLICLDDIHAIAGNRSWEEALFHLFNRAKEQGSNLIITSDSSPSSLQINLPDLISRLASGTSYRLTPLDDTAKITLLTDKAKERGMDLSSDTASYILKNYSRNISSLLSFLDQLDQASLAAQRKLTIPFVRDLLESEERLV